MNILNRLLAYSPDIKQSWMLFGIYILCLVVSTAVTAIMRKTGIATPEWSWFFSGLLGFAILARIVVHLGKDADHVPVKPPRQPLLLWLLLIPFTLSIGIIVGPLTTWIPMPDLVKQMAEEVFQDNLPAFLRIAVLAPVCEEWLFRGIILKGLLIRNSPFKAIMWSSIIFGVFHLNPWQTVSAFFYGLAIGWIYLHTRSLRYCIFMHMANNAVMFFLTIGLFPDIPDDITLTDLAGGHYAYIVVIFVCALTMMWIKKTLISSGVTADKKIRNCNGT